MTSLAPRIALIGDLHSAWDDRDATYFSQSDYQHILLTGDLGNSGRNNGVKIATSLARIERDTLVMPGNNDVNDYAAIVAELNYQAGRSELLAGLSSSRQGSAVQKHRVQICGYSVHPISLDNLEVTVLAARPFAMGGNQLSFADALSDLFDVHNLEESTSRLKALVDAAETEHLVFFAHNGPRGLGDQPHSPFGRDFHPDAGDWGDVDLEEAIVYARARGHRVLAVVAGHMHWSTRVGGERIWQVERDGVLYVNTARVPRHAREGQTVRRHHLALALTCERASVEEVWVFF